MADKATIGNVEVTAVIDMVPPPREPSAMFPDVPADAWASYQDTLEDGQLQLYYGVFLLKTTILVFVVLLGVQGLALAAHSILFLAGIEADSGAKDGGKAAP